MTNIDDLVTRNMKLAPFMINKLGLGHKMDDYIDLAWIGLVKGAKTYDPEKGKESTYLCNAIYLYLSGYLQGEARKNKNKPIMLSLDYVLPVNENETYTLGDTLGKEDEDKTLLYSIEKEANIVLKAMKNMGYHNQYADVVCDYFGFNREKLSSIEIRKKYNISKMVLSLIINKFRTMLRKRLGMEKKENGNKRIKR